MNYKIKVSSFSKNKCMLGVVLSGGGARCIAHLGILKVLDENNIKVDMISGVSGGALTGALYSYGYSPDEILEIILNLSLKRLFRPVIGQKGLMSMQHVERLIKGILPETKFEDLKIPFYTNAVQLHLGETFYFSEGDLIPPLLASNCLPVIFAPVEINGALFVDGGIINNLPAEPLRNQCDLVLGLHSNAATRNFIPRNIRSLTERVCLLAINYNAEDRKKMCDVFWEPQDLQHFRISDINKATVIFEIGYKYGKEHISELLEKIEHVSKIKE